MASLDLVFSRARYSGGPLDLVFGGGGGEPPALPLTAEITLYLSGPVVSMTAIYDNRLPNYVTARTAVRHQVATPAAAERAAGWARPAPITGEGAAAWQSATDAQGLSAVGWNTTAPMASERREQWEAADKISALAKLGYQVCGPVDLAGALRWQAASALARTLINRHQVAAPALRQPVMRSRQGLPLARTLINRHQVATPALVRLLARWQEARPLPPGLSIYVPPGGGDGTPREISLDLLFACPPYEPGAPLDLVFGHVCGGGVGPYPPETIVVPVRSVYMTVNSLALVRVSDGAVIPASGFGLELSADAWTWSWSATVQGSAMALFAPDVGDPVELEANINGVAFRLVAEEVGRTRRFGENALAVSGRGLAAELDLPYAPTLNFSAASDRTAQQLAGEALQLNGVSIGWALDWNLTDWLVPGGVWSHQGSHISAVKAIAAAVGGYVQPHRTAKTLRILHRYPLAPWDWASATPDVVLPSAPVIVEGIKWSSFPDYNRIFVSGQGAGVLGQVTRTGTAGDIEAPMVVDQLITHSDAARQRGRAELSNTGRQALVSLSLPVLSETGLILPGQFLEYVDGSETRRGLVRGSALSWDRPRMRQQITVETHEETA